MPGAVLSSWKLQGPVALSEQAAGLTCQSSLTSPPGSSRLSDASRAGSPGLGVRPNSSEPSAWEMAQSAWKVTGPQCALRTLRRIGGQPGRSEWKLSGAHSAGRGHGNKHFCHQPKCSCQQKLLQRLLPSRVQIAGQEMGERGERKWRCRLRMHRAADPNWGWARPDGFRPVPGVVSLAGAPGARAAECPGGHSSPLCVEPSLRAGRGLGNWAGPQLGSGTLRGSLPASFPGHAAQQAAQGSPGQHLVRPGEQQAGRAGLRSPWGLT